MIKFIKKYYGVEFDVELKDKICLQAILVLERALQ